MKKFWKWKNQTVTNQDMQEQTLERTLFLNGTIAEESWFDDDITPKLFRDEQIKRINDLQDYIAQQNTYLTEFDESLVRRWIKQITIWDDHITAELKSGVSIDVDA